MKSNSWSNISGSIYIECGFVDGKLIDSHTDKELPQLLVVWLKTNFNFSEEKDYFEIEIPFLSSGFSDPGKLYGPPENCYPPEGDDERLLDDCCIVTLYYILNEEDGWQKQSKNLSKEISEEIFEFYHDQIYDEELDFSQYDDSDYLYERLMEGKINSLPIY